MVNVAMVAEGVDVPGIKTVFLTRPTQSELERRWPTTVASDRELDTLNEQYW